MDLKFSVGDNIDKIQHDLPNIAMGWWPSGAMLVNARVRGVENYDLI